MVCPFDASKTNLLYFDLIVGSNGPLMAACTSNNHIQYIEWSRRKCRHPL